MTSVRPRTLPTGRGLVRALALKKSPSEMTAYQVSRLRELVAHAGATVPYYRRLFDRAGVSPHQIRTLEDLSLLPITEKDALRCLPDAEVISSRFDPKRLIRRRTSGSSGTPLVVRRTWTEQSLLHLFRLRAWRSVGLRATDRRVSVGAVRENDSRDGKAMGRVLGAAGLHRHTRVDVFRPPRELLPQLEELRPDVLHGYPGALARVADLRRERESTSLSPRFLMTGAEVLSPQLRRRIEEGFGVPVYDFYGTHELNLVAWECVHTGAIHTCDDALIFEVMVDGRPAAEGERGEVVVTGLYSYAMPFIRYKLGDLVVRGRATCRCGAPFSTILAIEGRTFEYFPLPDGRSIHAHEIGLRLAAAAGGRIRQYQLVQERTDRILLRVVPEPSAPPAPAELHTVVRELIGEAAELEVELVDAILPDSSGKSPPYRSLLNQREPGD